MSDRKVVVRYKGANSSDLQSADTAVISNLGVTNQGVLQLRELSSNGNLFIGLKSPASLSGSTTFTLPTGDGSSGQFLKTNGSAVLSWGSSSAAATYYQETPTGTVNSSNTSFTIANVPGSNAAVLVYKNGLLQAQTADYSISTSTITFTTAPTTGSTLYVVYSTASNDVQETPSGTVNSSNVTFTLANTPNAATSVMLFLDGLLQKGAGSEYSISGSTITMVTAPTTGQSIYAAYKT